MNRKHILAALFAWSVFYAALCGGELRIIATSDLHGGLRNYAVLAPAIRNHTDDSTIVVDAGDTVSGIFYSEYAERGSGMAEALNRCGVNFWVPGNHDFELPAEDFHAFIRRFNGVVLGGDWRKNGATGADFRIVRRGKLRCAIIGLTDPKMPRRILPGSGMEFIPAYDALSRVMPRVRAERPDVVVLVWHNGIHSTLGFIGAFLKHFPGIDLVVGGHSHEEHPGERIGGFWFVQPGSHGGAAAVIDVSVDDATGRVTGIRSGLIRGDPANPDRELLALERRLKLESDGLRRLVLGRFSPPLRQPEAGKRDSAFGRLCAAAVCASAGADAGVVAVGTGKFKTAEVLTYGDLFRLLPYRNEVCSLMVTRDELFAFLVEQDKVNRRWRRELFVSGVKTYRSPRDLIVAVDAPERLKLAVSDYMIAESAVLRPLVDKPERRWRRTGVLDRDAVTDFLKKSGKSPR